MDIDQGSIWTLRCGMARHLCEIANVIGRCFTADKTGHPQGEGEGPGWARGGPSVVLSPTLPSKSLFIVLGQN